MASVAALFLEQVLFNRRNQRQIKSFSNARSEDELLEEEIKYKIELEQLDNKINLLETLLKDYLDTDESIEKLSGNYVISRVKPRLSKEEIEDNVKNLISKINEKFEELEHQVRKNSISNIFSKVRNCKEWLKLDILKILNGGATAMLISFLAFLSLNAIVNPLLMITIGFLGGTAIAGIYVSCQNRNLKKVFEKFNGSLGDEALPYKETNTDDFDDKQHCNRRILDLIQEIKDLSIELFNLTRDLDEYNEEEKLHDAEETQYIPVLSLDDNLGQAQDTIIDIQETGKSLSIKPVDNCSKSYKKS